MLKLALESNLVECNDKNLEPINQFQNYEKSELAATYIIGDKFLNSVDFSEACTHLGTTISDTLVQHISDYATNH